jgi:hypothetical protein
MATLRNKVRNVKRSFSVFIRAGSVSDGLFRALAMILFASSATARADEPAPSAAIKPMETVTKKTERYLGIVTEPISAAMAAQLKDALPDGCGVLVKRVLPDSPAAKAGLEPFDIVFQVDAKSVATSDELKAAVTTPPAGQALRLQFLRGAKVQTIGITPGERTVSRMIVRHKEVDSDTEVAAKHKRQMDSPSEPYSVSVQTKNGRDFRVDIRIGDEESKSTRHNFSGDATVIAKEMKSLPEPVQKSLTRQLARLQDDRPSPRSVQFRFRPQREGNRQVLVVSLRNSAAAGAIQSFELQQPLAEATAPIRLDKLLDNPEFAVHLKDLDPAVRMRIESTLKTASLPAGTLKVEDSQ